MKLIKQLFPGQFKKNLMGMDQKEIIDYYPELALLKICKSSYNCYGSEEPEF